MPIAWVGNYFPIKDKEGCNKWQQLSRKRASRAATPDDVCLMIESKVSLKVTSCCGPRGTSTKTATRWERGYNLPVHRVLAGKGAVVFALKSEVGHCMRVQAVRTDGRQECARTI